MYTPTKSELIEMQFKYKGGWFEKVIKTKHCNPYKELPVDSVLMIDYFEDENTWQIIKDGLCRNIYPRSLDHLKQVILAFNPTE